MSLVCFPFKEEDVVVVIRNVEIAAGHHLVSTVLCVGYSKGETWHAIRSHKTRIEAATGKRIILLQQKRIGVSLRSGKGDGMNTALAFFLDHPELKRIHFYDADIVSFSPDWITKAERQADLDFDVVRHYFPRSSTDAMITWFVTKVGFCLLWPSTVLPFIEQPLGGELLLTRRAAEILYSDLRVRRQSDWGIDTLYTFVMVQKGLHLAEVYIPEGKVHALYSGLKDLKTMLVECFSAMQSLKDEIVPGNEGTHRMEHSRPVPDQVKRKVAYDVEKTLKLLKSSWTPGQRDLLQKHFDPALVKGLANASEWPGWGFADEEAWVSAYKVLLNKFEKGDEDWEELLFKIWVSRVLNHTMRHALRGYDAALDALRNLIWETQHKSAMVAKASSIAASAARSIASGHSAAEAELGEARKKNWSKVDAACAV